MNLKRFTLLLFLLPLFSWAQEEVTISGYLTDESNGEGLIGASVYVEELKAGTITNVYGFYSLTLPKGTYNIKFSYIGYKPIKKEMVLEASITTSLELSTNSELLSEVVVTAEKEDQNIREVQMSVERMDIKVVEKIPQFLGEADIVKSLQLRPGVTSVGEGANGFNVRGGNIDQNLILLDESPVFSSSHLFGFFSVFNPDAIKDAQLYKGGIPARYGGRLSSVMDVRQREGNSKGFHGQGGLGILSSRLTLEGPIGDDISFLVSGRRSYADLFLKFDEDLKDNQAYFYDLNAKINWKISPKDRLYLSGYFGEDVFGFGDDFRTSWGNVTGSLRWNHLFSDKLFSNFTAVYSDYGYSLGVPTGAQAFNWEAQIETAEFKADFTWYANPKNQVTYGVDAIRYHIAPGRAEGTGSESFFNVIEVPNEYAWHFAGYINNEQKIGDKITFAYGLRYAHFFNVGKTEVNIYEYGVPTVSDDIIETVQYDRNEVIADYGGFEPRIGFNYMINDSNSIKVSYMRNQQFIHLVSNTTSATPVDVWKPAGKYVDPGVSDQVAIGYFKNLKRNTYNISAEAYYKQMNDLLDYRNGAELLLNDNVETEFLSGKGTSYGLELMFEKKKGLFTGWIAYTLSRTELVVDGFTAGDYTTTGVNYGEANPSNWDKTHDLTIVGMYQITDRWSGGANFIYTTGRPASYPEGRFNFDGKVAPIYRFRNEYRIPNTVRLDISATREGKKRENFETSWVFGVYNVLGRKNPYSVFFQPDENMPTITQAQQLSIIGIPVPAITWNFKF